MKLVIAGSRDIPINVCLKHLYEQFPYEWLSELTGIGSGKARGADTAGEIWARTHNIPIEEFPPDKKNGFPAALFIRNQEMADWGDKGLILWDGKSRGSMDMKKRLEKQNKEVRVILVNFEPEIKIEGLELFYE